MSKVAIVGDASGTGTFTISAPNGNTDRTLVLPDEAGTVLTTAGVPASAMPAGSVIQVVSAVYAVGVNTTSASYVDTGLTATITPTSATSKILVLVSQSGLSINTGGSGVMVNLVRNSTQLIEFARYYMYSTPGSPVGASASYLDSPTTTSATTYKTQYKRGTGSGTVYANDNSSASTITLVEIAG